MHRCAAVPEFAPVLGVYLQRTDEAMVER